MFGEALDLVDMCPPGVVPKPLGQGWIAEEAAAIALWCCLVAGTPIEAVLMAVNIDGDSDTTGSLVGQVLGAYLGAGWIPDELLDQLELRQAMEALAADADALFNQGLVLDTDQPEGQRFWDRYPGW
jgi:hypothetical protein